MVVFGQCGFIRSGVVVFGQKLFYSGKCFYLGKSGCYREKVAVFRQDVCIRPKWLYSGKVVVYLGKSGFYRTKEVVFGIKVFVFGQIGCIR